MEDKDRVIEELTRQVESLTQGTINPKHRTRLWVQDLNNLRALGVANSFLFYTAASIAKRIPDIKNAGNKEQWELLHRETNRIWTRVRDLLAIMVTDMSCSNWNRLLREIQSVVDMTVDNMNRGDLGSWTVGVDDRLDKEFDVRKRVEGAVALALCSAGTNSLTAYSRKLLEDAIVRIVGEK